MRQHIECLWEEFQVPERVERLPTIDEVIAFRSMEVTGLEREVTRYIKVHADLMHGALQIREEIFGDESERRSRQCRFEFFLQLTRQGELGFFADADPAARQRPKVIVHVPMNEQMTILDPDAGNAIIERAVLGRKYDIHLSSLHFFSYIHYTSRRQVMFQSHTVYEGEDFRDETLRDIQLTQTTFENCRFTYIDATEFETEQCRFINCDFTDSKWNASRHSGSSFLNCQFNGANLFLSEFDQCKMTGSSFESCTFEGVVVREGDWSFVNLRHAPLRKMDWSGVRLTEADLYGADLKESRWTNAVLSRAVLQHADCTGADFVGAEMDGVDFSDVILKQATLDVMQAVQVARSLGANVI